MSEVVQFLPNTHLLQQVTIMSDDVTRLTRRVPLMEQELLTLSEHMGSPPVL